MNPGTAIVFACSSKHEMRLRTDVGAVGAGKQLRYVYYVHLNNNSFLFDISFAAVSTSA
jgi:hypothetical protein